MSRGMRPVLVPFGQTGFSYLEAGYLSALFRSEVNSLMVPEIE